MTDLDYTSWLRTTLSLAASAPQAPDVLGAVLRSSRLQRSGTWAEFGVASGASLTRLARFRGQAKVWGFDTFTGLPEEWVRKDKCVHKAGHFAQDKIPNVPGAHIVSGLFQDTLPSWNPPAPITLAHIDCDIYSGAICALRFVVPRLAPGAIVVFDEMLVYPGFEEHEIRALYEATVEFGLEWEFLFVGGERAAIQVTGKREGILHRLGVRDYPKGSGT